MATAPVVVVLFDRLFLFDSTRETMRSRWRLYGALASTWTILVLELAAAPRANSAGFETGVGVWTYVLNQSVMVVRYLRLTFWPADLVINYGPPVAYTLGQVLPQAALVAGLLLATVAAFRWSPAAAFLGAWFFITLGPSSSFVPIATEVGAERRMYLPLMAIVAGLVLGAYRWLAGSKYGSRNLAVASITAAAVALGAATIRRNAEHQSWTTLAETTLARWPTDGAYAGVGIELASQRRDADALPLLRIGARSDPRARYNLGITLFNLARYEEAIAELKVLVAEHPMREEVPWAHRVMGHAYLRLSRWPPAITEFRIALIMTPHDAETMRLLVDAYNSYGVDLAQSGSFDAAIREFREALRVDERNPSARYNLATALFDSRRLNEASVEAARALALDAANADAHHLMGKLLALEGRMPEAVAHLETAVKLRPRDEVIQQDLARVRQFARSPHP
jgi:tetratricopeptide (TPR) repeat protein